MTASNPIVRIPIGVVKTVPDLFFDDGFQRLSQISDYLDSFTVSCQGSCQEQAGGWNITPLRHENVDDGFGRLGRGGRRPRRLRP